MMNRQITLANRPAGMPSESDFKLVETPVPSPREGQVLLKILYLSVDPYLRGFMRSSHSYASPIEIGQVMAGGTVAEVVESRNPKFQPGDIVESYSGWQEYALSDGSDLRKIDPSAAPISTALGILGMPGMTAYFGLLEIGQPKPGDTVVVSGAAGAVGSAVGQIARIAGCRVVGTAGSDEKVRYLLEELQFDAAFNYKKVTDYQAKLSELCPSGIDVYFDNTGGPVTDAVFPLINNRARLVLCGQISQYNLETPEMGPRLLFHLVVKRARAEGFLVFDYTARYPEARERMAKWIREGRLKYRETVVDGIENAPKAFLSLFTGENIGKELVKVA
jgi:Putative NADP-dependent oxidoreductases